MKYLLIGGAGYIGSHIAEQLNELNEEVFIYDNLSTGFLEFVSPKNKLFENDVLDLKQLQKCFKEVLPDVVIYLAGLIKVGESVNKPLNYYETNIEGLINVLKCIDQFKIKNLIFSSSAAVYGNESDHNGIFFEDDLKKPCSPYGNTKLFCEQIIMDYSKTRNNNFNFALLRYFNVAGASKSGKIGYLTKGDTLPTHLFPAISYFVFGKNSNFRIFGNDYKTKDGTCIRDYVHVVELAKLHILVGKYMMVKKENCIFNIGNSKGFSNLEIINSFRKVLNNNFNVTFGKRRKGDPDILVANSEKIQKALNYKFEYSLDDIVKSELAFRKKHLK